MAHLHDVARFTTAPDLADLEAYAREAFATVPGELRRYLGDVVRHVLIHEIGHHFGLSDEDMDRIEAEA
jgi:predicted Zn-dependent protease with MMP-like domain